VTKHIGWRIWIAFMAPTIPLAQFAPFLASRGYATRHGVLNAEFDYFSFILRDGHALILVFLAATAAYAISRKVNAIAEEPERETGFRVHEAAAIAGYFVLPVAMSAVPGLHPPVKLVSNEKRILISATRREFPTQSIGRL
jgi:hypothetical protein